MAAELKPVYLVAGDDEPKIDAWRARIRRRAEGEGGPGALETFDAGASAPDDVAAALATLTFSTGERFLLVNGVETWKAGALEPLEGALRGIQAGTVLVLLARGEAPERLAAAVKAAGGECRRHDAPKARELPRWAAARAQEEGLELDAEAARALVDAIGPRQQRLAREIEKLALLAHPDTRLSADDVTRIVAGETSLRAYDLADALVAGDLAATLAIAEELTVRDERPSGLVFTIVRRLREVQRALELLDAGVPEGKVASRLGGPAWLGRKTVEKAQRADREAVERALCLFADFEVDARGGGDLDEATAFSLALTRAAA